MRIAELSQTTGVPVPTIKYYLREGLLPAGELTSPNQAMNALNCVGRSANVMSACRPARSAMTKTFQAPIRSRRTPYE